MSSSGIRGSDWAWDSEEHGGAETAFCLAT